ncbi:MAG: hypothetical protein J0M17_06895 [Planctomycetes bacterium]|nr:hypothetical protein [Planctomycetota bacterium]
MSRLAVDVPVIATGFMAAGEGAGNDRQSALDNIATFIPSEAMGVYVVGFGIMQPSEFAEKWGLFALATVAIPLVFGLRYWEARRDAEQIWAAGRAWGLLFVALVSFVVWAAAMPQSPFIAFHPRMNLYAAVAALFLATFLPRIAKLIGWLP